MAEKSLEERIQRIEKKIQHALDVQEIQKVMSMHQWYGGYTAGTHKEELKAIWAQKAPDVSFGQNPGMWVGMESIEYAYAGGYEDQKQEKQLEEMIKLFPEIKKKKENYGIGLRSFITLTTPTIEVAGDGETAKGMWYAPGYLTSISDGKLQANWMWERYAIDFLKEDGKWKIWHFNVFTDLMTPYEMSWVQNSLQPHPSREPMPGAPKRDIAKVRYESYSHKGVRQTFPKPPEPYQTFSETFSYGPTPDQLAQLNIKVEY